MNSAELRSEPRTEKRDCRSQGSVHRLISAAIASSRVGGSRNYRTIFPAMRNLCKGTIGTCHGLNSDEPRIEGEGCGPIGSNVRKVRVSRIQQVIIFLRNYC